MKEVKTDSKLVRVGKKELQMVQMIKAQSDSKVTQEELINEAIREYCKSLKD